MAIPDKRNDEISEWIENEARVRDEYLAAIGAIPAPKELYALWLASYAQSSKGPNINQSPYPYETTRSIDSMSATEALNLISEGGPAIIGREPYTRSPILWLATKSTHNRLPKAHGANALHLLYLPDLINLNVDPYPDDNRPGWEYGHTELYTLSLDRLSRTGARATTNDIDGVKSFSDINFSEFKPRSIAREIREACKTKKRNTTMTVVAKRAIEQQLTNTDELR